MLLGASHAGRQVLEAIHVEPSTPVTRWQDPVSALELFHSGDHLGFVRSAVVEPFCRRGLVVRDEGGWRVWDWDGGGGVE